MTDFDSRFLGCHTFQISLTAISSPLHSSHPRGVLYNVESLNKGDLFSSSHVLGFNYTTTLIPIIHSVFVLTLNYDFAQDDKRETNCKSFPDFASSLCLPLLFAISLQFGRIIGSRVAHGLQNKGLLNVRPQHCFLSHMLESNTLLGRMLKAKLVLKACGVKSGRHTGCPPRWLAASRLCVGLCSRLTICPPQVK